MKDIRFKSAYEIQVTSQNKKKLIKLFFVHWMLILSEKKTWNFLNFYTNVAVKAKKKEFQSVYFY